MRFIITIQHTQSVHHTNGMVGSWTDWDITSKGVEQAENIGINLKKHFGNMKWVMYSSDLLRARHTAEIVGKHLGTEPILTEALRERNLGRCVGKSVQWMRENMEKREETVDDRMFSDAESKRDEWNRLEPFFDQILAMEDNVILVSHGDLLSVFNSMWLELPVESLNRVELFGLAGGVSVMIQDDNGKRLVKQLSDLSFAVTQ